MATNTQANKYIWKQDKWMGGQSDDGGISNPGGCRSLVGLDIFSDSGFIQLARATKLIDTVTKTIKWIEPNPNSVTDVYYYGEDTIYKEVTTASASASASASGSDTPTASAYPTEGTLTAVHTLTLDSPNGQGLRDFNGYLYYRTKSQLGRFNYNATWDDDFATGLANCTDFGMLYPFKNYLLVPNGRYLGVVDDVAGGTWNPTRLTLPVGYTIRGFARAGSYVGIILIKGSAVTDSEEGYILFWDGAKETYNDFYPIDGNPHAIAAIKNKFVLISGSPATIQESQGGIPDIKMTIPNIEPGNTCEVWPGAIDVWNRKVYFGISSCDATNVVRAVHAWGSKNAQLEALYGTALSAELPISTARYGSTVAITAIRRVGTTLRIAWVDGAIKGVDKVETNEYQKTGILRTIVFDNNNPFEKDAKFSKVHFAKPLIANQSVTFKVSRDPYNDPLFTDSNQYQGKTETTVGAKKLELSMANNTPPIKNSDLHAELTLSGNGSLTPQVKRFWTEFDQDEDNL